VKEIVGGLPVQTETAPADGAKIFVTEPHRPSRAVFDRYIDQIWERNWFTNNGPLVCELETRLKARLGVDKLAFVTNGTIALQVAIEALRLEGEVLTTAFSFVATASSIAWQKLHPKMVDVLPGTLNIDPKKIEESIGPNTTSILATHVFGNPCELAQIKALADKYGLKVLYDGAHAFGTAVDGRSILDYGDASIVSFHATKLYHSVEGGGVVAQDPEVFNRVCEMRNFGMNAQGVINGVGINGKNSEFHAAMGLSNLEEFDHIVSRRRELSELYDVLLSGLPLTRPITPVNCTYNYAYYPVVFESEAVLLGALASLNSLNIFPRRYFYPSLSTLDYVDKGLGTPVSDDYATRIACLPLHTNMSAGDVGRVGTALANYFGEAASARRRYA